MNINENNDDYLYESPDMGNSVQDYNNAFEDKRGSDTSDDLILSQNYN